MQVSEESRVASASDTNQEVERQRRMREREIQQLQLLEEKEKEVAELTSRLAALNRTYAEAQQDLEAETARAALLMNDIETSQNVALGFQAQCQSQEEDFKKRTLHLRIAGEVAARDLHYLRIEQDTLQKEHQELVESSTQEITSLKERLAQLEEAKEKEDTEGAMLMRLLHAELDKYKGQAAQFEVELERRQRDEVRSTVMLGLLNSQVDQHVDENQSLEGLLREQRRQLDRQEQQLSDSQAKAKSLEEEVNVLQAQLQSKTLDADKEIFELREKLDVGARTRRHMEAALDDLHSQLAAVKQEASAADKAAFEKNILLQSDLDQQQKLAQGHLRDLEVLKQIHAQQLASLEQDYARLQTKHEELQAIHQAEHSSDTESIAALKAEVQDRKARCLALEKEVSAQEKELRETRLKLLTETELLRSKMLQEKDIATARERKHFEDLCRAEQLLGASQGLEATLNGELEQARQTLVQTQIEAKKATQHADRRIAQLEAQVLAEQEAVAEAQRTKEAELARQAEAHRIALQVAQDDLDHLTKRRERTKEKKRAAREEVRQVKEVMACRGEEAEVAMIQYRAQIAALKAEVEGYQESITKLEGEIRRNYNFKLLSEQNDLLKYDVEALRNQNASLVRKCEQAEAAVVAAHGQVATAQSKHTQEDMVRIEQLEREHRMVYPLMAEMIATLNRHGLSGILKRDIEVYKQAAEAVERAPGFPRLVLRGDSFALPADQSKALRTPNAQSLAPLQSTKLGDTPSNPASKSMESSLWASDTKSWQAALH
eukprot:GGOE01045449.1.p1 GENE.GGOE01045449.1~~GGOE01045449.1.p1  ORF type:complete len:778 (-),score=292.65 GGOE01045449.1:386-2719(-)